MFMESITLTTIADFLIIGSVGYSLYVFVSLRRNFSLTKASIGLIAIPSGLSLIALIYLGDLVTMHLFPLFMPKSQAMAVMRELHLNTFWIMALFGLGAISFGFAATNKNIVRVVKELRDTEERFSVAVSGTNDGLWDWNILTEESYFSPRWKQILGYDDHELENVKQTFVDALHPEDKERVMAAVRTHLETRHPYDIEFRLRHKDGHYVWVRSKGEAIWDENGNPRRMAGAISNITARKRAEEEAAKQSALLETTFQCMSQGFAVYDSDLKLVAFNRYFVDMMRYPPDLIRVGISVEEILRFRVERGDFGPAPDVEEIVREGVETRRRGVVYRRERVLPDGRVITVSRDPMPGGYYVTTYTDITEIKQAEEALRASQRRLAGILSIAPEAIISVDQGQRIQLFNQGAETIFGYSAQEALGQPLDILLPPRFRQSHRGYVEDFARTSEISRLMAERTELVGLRKDGTEFPAAASISKLELDEETVFTVILQDITERKRAEEALKESERSLQERVDILEETQRRLEQQGEDLTRLAGDLQFARDEAAAANRAKSEFLANMSHELRTPLNAILGFSEVMGKATLGPLGNLKYEEYIKDINDSGRHLLGLIQDILDLSKIEAGRLELDEEEIDVAAAIDLCLVLVRERAKNGGISLKTDIPEEIPPLYADQRKLKQILVNLLANAVKFTPAGGEVMVKAWWRGESGHVFQIIDTGIGIALEDIPKALLPFGQVDSQLDRKYEGTGLGLPLTKSLVEAHGGSLDLQSEVGAGTAVTVRFPKERIVKASEAAAANRPAL